MTAILNFFRKRSEPQKKAFTLNEWEIWHTYSTYFTDKSDNLEGIANTLVGSGFAEYSCTSSGSSYWRTPDGPQAGKYSVKLDTTGQKAKFHVKTLNGTAPEITDYALECSGISANLRYAELRLFRGDPSSISDYVRAFLSPCQLIHSDFGLVQCYPIITLYENGIVLVHLRTIGPTYPISLNTFIEEYINVHCVNFEKITVPPAIAKLLPLVSELATAKKFSIIGRIQLARKFSQHSQAIDKLTCLDKSGDFEHQFVDLKLGEQEKTTTSLAHDLFNIIGYLRCSSNNGLPIRFNRWHRLSTLGHYWCGHPHIHIVRHSQQATSASQNEELHRQEFNKILTRASTDQREVSSFSLPPSVRPFEDYAVYCGLAATLWVWSMKGVNKQEEDWGDKNRDHFIYEHQVQVEILEYGHMLYRSLIEQTQTLSKHTTIFQARKKLADLTLRMSEISPYGEIRDFLERGWDAMGVNLLKNHLQENLQILENRIAIDESEKRDLFQIYLTIIFGVIAVPPFASEVVAPVWNILNLWQPQDEDIAKLLFIAISMVFVTFLIIGVRRSRRK